MLITEIKRFRKNDDGFVCRNCGKEVPPLSYSSRNHCPFCLCSIHIDNNPGDRSNECLGLLRPIFCEINAKKGFIILFECEKCREKKRNRAAEDDNMDLIIKLTNAEYKKWEMENE